MRAIYGKFSIRSIQLHCEFLEYGCLPWNLKGEERGMLYDTVHTSQCMVGEGGICYTCIHHFAWLWVGAMQVFKMLSCFCVLLAKPQKPLCSSWSFAKLVESSRCTEYCQFVDTSFDQESSATDYTHGMGSMSRTCNWLTHRRCVLVLIGETIVHILSHSTYPKPESVSSGHVSYYFLSPC